MGAVVFMTYAWYERGQQDLAEGTVEGNESIFVDQATLDHLTTLWKLQWRSDPAPDDIAAIVDRHVRQEVFYREALAMDLDRNDEIIKKRLSQKMEAIANDLSTLMRPPTDQNLREFFESREEMFTLPPAFAFEQVLFLNDESQVESQMMSTLAALRQGAAIPRERRNKLSVPAQWSLTAIDDLDNAFGGAFAESLASLPVGEWDGPVRSGFGWHLVLVEDKREALVPELDEVRDYVAQEYQYHSVLEAQDEVFRELLAKYNVSITADVPAEVREEFGAR
jgi:peptidyl-prolyl cis-trans isomerase C